MPDLRLKRLKFCREADNWLRVLKSRTGITPNVLCRLGFCASLDEPGVPDVSKYNDESDREINRYTLLGEYESVLLALLRQRLARDDVDGDSMDEMFRGHMNRGVMLLAGRLKGLADLDSLASAK